MRIPDYLKDGDKTDAVEYAVERLKSRKKFKPGKRYNLLERVRHRTPASHKEYEESPGRGLLTRNSHWEKVRPIRHVELPGKDEAVQGQTSLHDMQSKEDFFHWFEDRFQGLDPGIYGAVQGAGRGIHTLFVLKYEDGEVKRWEKKSRSQPGSGEGEYAQYYALPFYFWVLEQVFEQLGIDRDTDSEGEVLKSPRT